MKLYETVRDTIGLLLAETMRCEPDAWMDNVDNERDSCLPATRLVYVLDHKYTASNMAFETLKNKDRIVTQWLAKYCEEGSQGKLALYLARVRYFRRYVIECGRRGDLRDSAVTLCRPWIKYGSTRSTTVINALFDAYPKVGDVDSMVNPWTEVAPAKYFESVVFDGTIDLGYTGNEGQQEEDWYHTTAVVIQPVYGEWVEMARLDYSIAIDEWMTWARTRPRDLYLITKAVFDELRGYRRWTSDNPDLIDCICLATDELADPEVFAIIISTCSFVVPADTRLGDAMARLGEARCVERLLAEVDADGFAMLVLMCNLITEATPLDVVGQLLDAVVWPDTNEANYNENTRAIVTQGLQFAARVSLDHVRRLLLAGDATFCHQVTTPAFVGFAHMQPTPHGDRVALLRDELVLYINELITGCTRARGRENEMVELDVALKELKKVV